MDLRAGREVVIVPVTITPTEPLTPTDVKGLLWTGVLRKATSLIAPGRLDAYFQRVEADGWMHPAGRRMLESTRGGA